MAHSGVRTDRSQDSSGVTGLARDPAGEGSRDVGTPLPYELDIMISEKRIKIIDGSM